MLHFFIHHNVLRHWTKSGILDKHDIFTKTWAMISFSPHSFTFIHTRTMRMTLWSIHILIGGPTWEEASKETKWLCPSCLGTCICQRCNTRPIEFVKTPPSKKDLAGSSILICYCVCNCPCLFRLNRWSWVEPRKNSKEQAETNEIGQHMAALKQNFMERERFIQEIHNLLCMMKKEQRNIEHQITALQQSAEAKAQQHKQ